MLNPISTILPLFTNKSLARVKRNSYHLNTNQLLNISGGGITFCSNKTSTRMLLDIFQQDK